MMDGLKRMRVCLLLNLIVIVQVKISTARRNDCEFPSSVKSVKSVTNVYDNDAVKQFCSSKKRTENKTPDNFEIIFRTRCKNHIKECEMSKSKDCDRLWNTFYRAFAYKKPCIEKWEYESYCYEAKHEVPKGKTLFYSGKGPYNVSHKDNFPYVTLEHTLTGNVLDGIDAWCGKLEKPGINYDECPDRNACHRPDPESNAKCAFWQQASIEFAKLARGQVYVLVDGAKENGDPAYSSTSYFRRYELPNLNKNKVTSIHILVMNSTKNITETCGKGSIKTLQHDIVRMLGSDKTVKCYNFTESKSQKAMNGTGKCFFPCSGSTVGLNFGLLLMCTFYAVFGKKLPALPIEHDS
ncbi:ADP-ribosyl cyclase/cyclic ADP-ribose hydrolase-like [Ptychodera flava]|uniref:ADP-ribosyl cyclase/cyclic ADP-ribose hydrolase-like n=1 Tax=Ptychodera flava TaxID=63121 RepID=UPI00396A5013